MKRIFKAIRTKAKNNKAFSLVEVLCAIVLLAIVATPILQAIMGGLNLNLKSRKLLGAADLTAGTMEFVSSLVFEDYSYTSGGTTFSVNGYDTYFWDCAAGVRAIYPNGPVGTFEAASGSPSQTVKITNIDYDGFKYKMFIKCSPESSTDEYFTYKVVVEVCENGAPDDVILSSAKTYIANKY